MKLFTPVLVITFWLSFSFSISAQNDFDYHSFKEKIHKEQSEKYKPSKYKPNPVKKPKSLTDRVIVDCQSKFLLGTNIAWRQYSLDLLPAHYDPIWFENTFTELEAGNVNSVRFWLHTNGVVTPLFEDPVDPLKCTGILSTDTINLKDIVDRAHNHGIKVTVCLWTHNMLTTADQYLMTQDVRDRNRKIIEDSIYTQYYIDNALLAFVKSLKDHPGLLAWEIYNEPEGICNGVPHNPTVGGWADFEHTEFKYIQQSINLMAGAIHRADPNALVTNGAVTFESSSNVAGFVNYYADDSLINRGGDADGYLDFYTNHYYTHNGEDESPFTKNATYWNLDKPLVMAEFYIDETFGINRDSLMIRLYEKGYAGAWAWDYKNGSGAEYSGWENMETGIQVVYDRAGSHDIDWEDKSCEDLNALFEVNSTTVCQGSEITFTDLSTSSPDSWEWNFGVGASPETAFGKGPHQVSYSSSGLKDIALTVTKGGLSETLLRESYVNVFGDLTINASDINTCDDTEIDFTADLGFEVLSNNTVTPGVSEFSYGSPEKSFTLNPDGTTTPSSSQIGIFLHGNWKSEFGTYLEFTGNFRMGATAEIFVASASTSPNGHVRIEINGVYEDSLIFSGSGSLQVNVPEGENTIRFQSIGNDWVELDRFEFTNIEQSLNYQWTVNEVNDPAGNSENFSKAYLEHLDRIQLIVTDPLISCPEGELKSNVIEMDCDPTSLDELQNEFTAYPNPTEGILRWDKSVNYELFDATGRILLEGESNQVNISGYKNGVYFLRLGKDITTILKK